MSDNNKEKRFIRVSMRLLVIVLPLVAIYLIVISIYAFTKSESIKIEFPGSILGSIELKRGETQYTKVMEKLFSDSYSAQAIGKWLKDEKNYYHIDDLDLSEKFSELFSEIDEENPIERHRKYSEILKEHKAINSLREKAFSYAPPFQHTGEKVKIGVPENAKHRPPPKKVNVPFNSRFVGKRIKICNPYSRSIYLILEGRPAFQKTDNVDIQLNYEQATYLFISIVTKTVEGIAYILPSTEDLYDPTEKK